MAVQTARPLVPEPRNTLLYSVIIPAYNEAENVASVVECPPFSRIAIAAATAAGFAALTIAPCGQLRPGAPLASWLDADGSVAGEQAASNRQVSNA